jgi:hypothetical protein
MLRKLVPIVVSLAGAATRWWQRPRQIGKDGVDLGRAARPRAVGAESGAERS